MSRISGWCQTHGTAEGFHGTCEERMAAGWIERCDCPRHHPARGVDELGSVAAAWENGPATKDGPRPAALTAGSSQGLARRYEGAPN